jgi:hypothetical protein
MLELAGQCAVAGGDDALLEIGKLGGGEAHRAGHRLAMDEGRIGPQLLAVLRVDLDVVAQNVIVAELERGDAGRRGVARLQRRDVLAPR